MGALAGEMNHLRILCGGGQGVKIQVQAWDECLVSLCTGILAVAVKANKLLCCIVKRYLRLRRLTTAK